MTASEIYSSRRARDGSTLGVIEVLFSASHGGWYAQEWDFLRGAVRTSARAYRSERELIDALNSGQHSFNNWPTKIGRGK